MFSIIKIFKKKKIVPHIRLSGVIGSVGKFQQGLNFSGQQELIDTLTQILFLHQYIGKILKTPKSEKSRQVFRPSHVKQDTRFKEDYLVY